MLTASPAAPQFDSQASTGAAVEQLHPGSSRRLKLALGLGLSALAIAQVGLELAHYLRPALLVRIFGAPSAAIIENEWLRPISCGILCIAIFFLLRMILQMVSKTFARDAGLPGRDGDSTSVERFVEEAATLHVDPQIARESFQLLASVLPAATSLRVNDDLRGSLHLSEQQINSLLSELPDLCERSRLPTDAASILSVYDLLHHMESLPRSESGRLYTRTGLPVKAAPAPASPLADLQNASPRDSRFRTRAHFSGVKRRASDYSGPYRRATDRRPDEGYSGPLRRASDRQSITPTASETRSGERRSSERRVAVPQESSEQARQHRAVSADSSLLNQCADLTKSESGNEIHRGLLPTRGADENAVLPAVGLHRG